VRLLLLSNEWLHRYLSNMPASHVPASYVLSACPFGYLWIISFSATQRHNTFLAAAYLLRCCRDAVIDDAACRPAAEVLCRCHSQCIHHAVIVAVAQANPWATELEELRVKYRLEVLQRKLLYNQVRINQFSTFRGSHGTVAP